MAQASTFTPRELVGELDRYIVGQGDAKRAVAEGLATNPMRLHDVRHWHATQLVAANTDIRTVADRLGHADAAFTINTYAHSSSESDRAAAAAIEAFQ